MPGRIERNRLPSSSQTKAWAVDEICYHRRRPVDLLHACIPRFQSGRMMQIYNQRICILGTLCVDLLFIDRKKRATMLAH
jgi:hypothetical protein